MSVGLAERAIVGVQTPRLQWMPEGEWDYSLGDRCIEWAETTLRVCLDDWQKLLLRMMLARRPDGRWACRQFALIISRQNGKSVVYLIRCLFGMIELGEREVVFSAHLGDTIRDAFDKAQALLLEPDDANKCKPGVPPFSVYQSEGRQRIRFESGATMVFRTRTKSGGRGLTGEVVVLDEAQELVDEQTSALGPILGSKSVTGNPQILLAGSAGDHESTVFARIRRQALAGGARHLGMAEWSIDDEAYFRADTFERERIVHDPQSYAQANPTLHIVRPDGTGGISADWLIEDELPLLGPVGQAREHLGVGTWPKDDGHDWLIPRLAWNRQARPTMAVPDGELVMAISAAWGDRAFSIAAAVGHEGGCYGFLQRQDFGSAWVVPDLVALVQKNETAAVVLDAGGPASSKADEIEKALRAEGVPLHRLSGREAAQAFGGLQDAITADPPEFWHRGQVEVDAALAGARKKDVGDGLWVFDRRKSETDIAPLEALALARFGWLLYGDGDGDGPNIW